MNIQKVTPDFSPQRPAAVGGNSVLPFSIYDSSSNTQNLKTPWRMDQAPPPLLHPPSPSLAIKFSQVSNIISGQLSQPFQWAQPPEKVQQPIPYSQNTELLSPNQLFAFPDVHTHSEVITSPKLPYPQPAQDLTQVTLPPLPQRITRPVARPADLVTPTDPLEGVDKNEIIDTGLKDARGRKISLTREAAQGLFDVIEIAKSKGIRVSVNSAHRTVEKQAKLWEQALRKYGSAKKARKWVAPPGKSRHNYGKAIDMHMYRGKSKIPQKEFDQIIAKAGMYRPMSWEGWHIEPLSTKGQRASGHNH